MRSLLFVSLFLPLYVLSSSPAGCLLDSSAGNSAPDRRFTSVMLPTFPTTPTLIALSSPSTSSSAHSRLLSSCGTAAEPAYHGTHEGYGSINIAEKANSIWDVYARVNSTVLDSVQPGDCGDQYDRYKEDIEILEQMGMDAYRFSIAWTRIFPNGTGADITPNADAIAHYNELIDLLLEKGIEPYVTLWAGDHPQALEDAYNGLLSARFI
ncbi:hypothetical protein GOP47_0002491 [Adiantum capillus-veneris]|uniref:Uncharacterized protein n=1 Tax=Adiantum capillus-veneris TaxID=13818 RepID=A0A9D4ZP55_ADICA|nr:hypothetical protein GOP47_0002491 [Adiantum capillus-veneris]